VSELAQALAELQANPPPIRKAARGQVGTREYKYATLDAIWKALEQWRLAHGIIWVCCPSLIDNRPCLTYRLIHIKTGEEISGHYPLTDAHGQALGADITYARRYALCAVLGLLADDDTDGRAIEPRQRSRVRVDTEHERLANSVQRQQPGDRPAARIKPGDNPPVDMWTDQPPGQFEIGTPEDRPGTIDRNQERVMHREFNRLGITDRGVRLGMTADILGRDVMTSKQLSRLEADHLIKALKAKAESDA
jgi:hypothetical protein